MSVLDSLTRWWKQEQPNWTLAQVSPPAGLPQDPDLQPYGAPILADKAYLRVKMRSMAIAATRAGWNIFHAALYSHVTVGLRDGSAAELQSVLSPDFFRGIDAKRLKNVMFIDRTVFGPVPYSGDKVTIRMGVFAIKDADLAAPFLNVLTELASTAGVAFVGAAQPFITPLKSAVELLTGTNDAAMLEIGLDRESTPPESGWFALVRTPSRSIKASDFSVAPQTLELVGPKGPLTGIPYLLFSVDALSRRGDWAQISELRSVYAEFKKAADANNQNVAGELVKQFRRRALLSPELVSAHAKEIAQTVEQEYQALFTGGGVAAGPVRAATFEQLPVALTPL